MKSGLLAATGAGAGGAGGGGGGAAGALLVERLTVFVGVIGAGVCVEDRVGFDPRLSGLGLAGATLPNKCAANF